MPKVDRNTIDKLIKDEQQEIDELINELMGSDDDWRNEGLYEPYPPMYDDDFYYYGAV